MPRELCLSSYLGRALEMHGTWLKHLWFIQSCDKYLWNSDHVFRTSARAGWDIAVKTRSSSFVEPALAGRGGWKINQCIYNGRDCEEGEGEYGKMEPVLSCLCYCKWDGQEGFPSEGTFEQRPRWGEGMDHACMSGARVFWIREQQVQRTVSKVTFWN